VLEQEILGFSAVNEAEGTKGEACQELRKINAESKQGTVRAKTNHAKGSEKVDKLSPLKDRVLSYDVRVFTHLFV
jgi:hypothetical protein